VGRNFGCAPVFLDSYFHVLALWQGAVIQLHYFRIQFDCSPFAMNLAYGGHFGANGGHFGANGGHFGANGGHFGEIGNRHKR